jgi:hypothetical protein
MMQKLMLNFRTIGRRLIRRPLKTLLYEAEKLMAHDNIVGYDALHTISALCTTITIVGAVD